jgi:protein gp37
MSKTSIEWTERTWNPVRGCSRVSEGCRNCYAERMAARSLPGMNSPMTGEPFAIMTPSGPRWNGKVELIGSVLDIPLRRKKPTTWFVNSMSDLFHEGLSFETILCVYGVMRDAHWHTFQVLTKRADRRRTMMPKILEGLGRPDMALPNVHEGVSVEDQPTADARIPELLRTPAAKRFVSYEPALGPVDFAPWSDGGLECSFCYRWRGVQAEAIPDGNVDDPGFLCPNCGEPCAYLPLDERLDQIIIGGESGPGARPFHIQWARKTIAQCRAAGVKCFVKQLGAKPIIRESDLLKMPEMPEGKKRDAKGGDWSWWPEDLKVRETL